MHRDKGQPVPPLQKKDTTNAPGDKRFDFWAPIADGERAGRRPNRRNAEAGNVCVGSKLDIDS